MSVFDEISRGVGVESSASSGSALRMVGLCVLVVVYAAVLLKTLPGDEKT